MGSLYSDHPTWLHGLPAGLKLLVLALLGTGVFATQDLTVLFTCTGACVLTFASLGRATKPTQPLLIGLLITSVLIGLFHVYMQQPWLGVVSVLRLLCTTLMAVSYTHMTLPTICSV